MAGCCPVLRLWLLLHAACLCLAQIVSPLLGPLCAGLGWGTERGQRGDKETTVPISPVADVR